MYCTAHLHCALQNSTTWRKALIYSTVSPGPRFPRYLIFWWWSSSYSVSIFNPRWVHPQNTSSKCILKRHPKNASSKCIPKIPFIIQSWWRVQIYVARDWHHFSEVTKSLMSNESAGSTENHCRNWWDKWNVSLWLWLMKRILTV